MKINWFIASVFALSCSGAGSAQDDASMATFAKRYWVPTTADVSKIEREIKLPPGADPLQTYERYYTGTFQGSKKLVLGAFVGLQKLPREGSRAIVKPADMPAIADAGCGVIWLTYDPHTSAVRSIRCNGEVPPPPR